MPVLKLALLLLGALTLSALVWHIGIVRIYEAVARLGPLALVTILLPSLLMYLFEAYGWRVTLCIWADLLTFWRLWAIRTAGEVVNMTTPTAYVGGEPLKALLLKRHGIPMVEGMASVVTAKTTMTIAQILFILAGSYGRSTSDGLTIEVPLTRSDISEMAGTTTETTIRVMSRWQKQGLVTTDKHVVTIRDEVALNRLLRAA